MEEKTWENTENLVSEVIKDNQKQMKRWFLAFIITLAALVGTNAYWIYVFNSYEYVAQDGNGYNYYNSEIEGNVDNGSEN